MKNSNINSFLIAAILILTILAFGCNQEDNFRSDEESAQIETRSLFIKAEKEVKSEIDEKEKKEMANRAGTDYSNMPRTQGAFFGSGLNIIDSSVLTATNCVRSEGHDDIALEFINESQITEYKYKVVQSKKELREFLNVDASLELEVGSFSGYIAGSYLNNFELEEDYVYAVVNFDRKFRDFRIKNPEFKPAFQHLYGQPQTENFRNVCGDRFLNVMTTGGSYSGVLKIKSKSLSDKQEITANLELEIGSLEIDGSGNIVNASISDSYDISIDIFSQGAAGMSGVVNSFDSFIENYVTFKSNLEEANNDFIQSISGVDPESDEYQNTLREYAMNGYLVKYEGYEQVAGGVPLGGNQLEDSEIMDDYAKIMDSYNDIISSIEVRFQFPHEYVGMTLQETQQELHNLKSDIEFSEELLKNYARHCAYKTNRVCVDLRDRIFPGNSVMEDNNMVNPSNLEIEFPVEKPYYPSTCDERANKFTLLEEEGNVLFVGHDRFKPYFATCLGINDPERSSRGILKTYLDLENISSNTNNVRFNYSKYIKFSTDSNVQGDLTLVSMYQKLEVVDATERLIVRQNQENEVINNGMIITDCDGNEISQAEWGSVGTCNSINQEAGNINLEGTPFFVSEEVQFIANSSYDLVDTPMSFYEAFNYAMSEGGVLKTVLSENENSALQELLENNYIGSIWLGLMTKQTFDPEKDDYRFLWAPERGLEFE